MGITWLNTVIPNDEGLQALKLVFNQRTVVYLLYKMHFMQITLSTLLLKPNIRSTPTDAALFRLQVPVTSHSCHSCLQKVCHPTCKSSYSSKFGRTDHAQCCFKSALYFFFRVTVTGTKVVYLFVVKRLWL